MTWRAASLLGQGPAAGSRDHLVAGEVYGRAAARFHRGGRAGAPAARGPGRGVRRGGSPARRRPHRALHQRPVDHRPNPFSTNARSMEPDQPPACGGVPPPSAAARPRSASRPRRRATIRAGWAPRRGSEPATSSRASIAASATLSGSATLHLVSTMAPPGWRAAADEEAPGGLRHHRFVRGDDQQDGVDAAPALQDVAHEPLVAGHVDVDATAPPPRSGARTRDRW